MNTAPCRNCSDRAYLCHSNCDKYIKFKNWKETVTKKMREENDLNHLIVESIERLYSKKGRHPRKRRSIGKSISYE